MKRGNTLKRKKINDNLTGWLFILPMVVGTLCFLAFPLIFALIISFWKYQNFQFVEFVGFQNYSDIFYDEYFMKGMINILISCIGVPIGILLSLILTNIMVANPKFSIVFKTIYFIPTICGAVAITFIWKWMYAPMYGLINTFLMKVGWAEKSIGFLGREYFLPSLMVMGIWSGLGVSILLFFASLKSVSKQLYEAASIDGANFFQKFIHITLPAVSPTTFYILITGISGTLQEFSRFQIMRGGTGAITLWSVTPTWWIYYNTTAASGFNYGYASAMGIFLGILILIVSALQFVGSKLWVNYDS
ncbi:MAG TPA: sugar ABC transporter permease [Erysipelotrichaceae bacterium]|nr:sugar ABC transporter permease [Erysipelotrichaceae bacterium]